MSHASIRLEKGWGGSLPSCGRTNCVCDLREPFPTRPPMPTPGSHANCLGWLKAIITIFRIPISIQRARQSERLAIRVFLFAGSRRTVAS